MLDLQYALQAGRQCRKGRPPVRVMLPAVQHHHVPDHHYYCPVDPYLDNLYYALYICDWILKYLVDNATLFGYLFHRYRYIQYGGWWGEDWYIYYLSWGLLVVLSARCGLEAWMHWSSIDVIKLGFKSVEELYPSPPLGIDSADTSQLPKEKNLHGKFQYFQITQPGQYCRYISVPTNRGGPVPCT